MTIENPQSGTTVAIIVAALALLPHGAYAQSAYDFASPTAIDFTVQISRERGALTDFLARGIALQRAECRDHGGLQNVRLEENNRIIDIQLVLERYGIRTLRGPQVFELPGHSVEMPQPETIRQSPFIRDDLLSLFQGAHPFNGQGDSNSPLLGDPVGSTTGFGAQDRNMRLADLSDTEQFVSLLEQSTPDLNQFVRSSDLDRETEVGQTRGIIQGLLSFEQDVDYGWEDYESIVHNSRSIEEQLLRNAIDGLSTTFEPMPSDIGAGMAALRELLTGIGDDFLTGGDPAIDGNPGELQATIDCMLIGSGTLPLDVNNEPLGCATYNSRSKNYCFLPLVSLLTNTTNQNLANNCAGTIVGAHEILTAAHCVCEQQPPGIIVGTGVYYVSGQYTGLISEDDNIATALLSLDDSYIAESGLTSTIVPVVSSRVYDEEAFEYVCAGRGRTSPDDLAVIQVNTPSPFPIWARAVLIMPPSQQTDVNIAGFGPDFLQGDLFARTKRYGSSRYTTDLGGYHVVRDEESEVRDTCKGDSGSGVYIRLADGTLGIFGVLSGGQGDCSTAMLSRYVQITEPARLAWLQENVPELITRETAIFADDYSDCIGLGC